MGDKKVTKSGFEYKIQEEALDDWELLEKLRFIDKEPGLIIDVAYDLLGKEQVERLKDHMKEVHGKCSASAMIDEIYEILAGGKETKNS